MNVRTNQNRAASCVVTAWLVALASADAALAQAGGPACQPEWSTQFPESCDGGVRELYQWSNGPNGPRLIAGGSFASIEGVAGTNIMQFDGKQWSPMGEGLSGGNNEIKGIVEFDENGDGSTELYVAGSFGQSGSTPLIGIARWDGNSWSPVGDPLVDSGYTGIGTIAVYDDGGGPRLYVGGLHLTLPGSATETALARWDGETWMNVGEGTTGSVHVLYAGVDPASGEDVLFIAASGSYPSSPGFQFSGLGTWNGESFHNIGGVVTGNVFDLRVFPVDGNLYVAGMNLELAGQDIGELARWDGTSWHSLGLPPIGVGSVHSIEVFDDGSAMALYASFGVATLFGIPMDGLARWNGANWETVGDGSTRGPLKNSYDLAVVTLGDQAALWVANAPQHVWNGSSWQIRNSAIAGAPASTNDGPIVRAFCRFDDGLGGGERLIVAGEFVLAGPVRANSIAAWDGAHWHALGDGLPGVLRCVEPFDDGAGAALFAGRSLTGAPAVLRWNGVAWSDAGCPLRDVRDLLARQTPDGPRLLAAGRELVGGSPRVMQFDGTTWQVLGTTFNGDLSCLQEFDDGSGPTIYAGGWFTQSAGIILNGIARWDGTAWQPLGTGLSWNIHTPVAFSLAAGVVGSDGPRLFVGGNFDHAGGLEANNIASWDGQQWHALGAGFNLEVNGLGVFETPWDTHPTLYAAGTFSEADGSVNVNSSARWNGVYWQSLDPTFVMPASEDDRALCVATFVQDGIEQVFVGGSFDQAGTVSSFNISAWRGCAPVPPTFPICEYEVIPLVSNEPLEVYYAPVLTNDGRVLVSHIGQYSSPDALYSWTRATGLTAISLPAGTSRPYPQGMNDTGVFAAAVMMSNGLSLAHMNIAGQWQAVPALDELGYSSVTGLNSLGISTGRRGTSTYTNANDEAFTWANGVITPITAAGATWITPHDINDSSVVVGSFRSSNTQFAFTWSNGTLTPLPMLPNADSPTAAAINNAGRIAGSMDIDGDTTPVVWTNQVPVALPRYLGLLRSVANDINASGDVVGRATGYPSGSTYLPDRALLWRNGELIDLNDRIPSNLYIHLYSAWVINDAGEIICDTKGVPVLLRPVTPRAADINSDCSVNVVDLLIVINEWGNVDSPADITGDGVVNVIDLLLVINSWG